jgi:hypothetical protein
MGGGYENPWEVRTMAESKKKEPLCPFHRAEMVMDDLSTDWRSKAAKLTPQAAQALAQSLKSLRSILDHRIHDIEEKERAGGK